MATLQEKIYEHEDFFINKILYPMTKRKFDTLNQGARKRFIEAEENGVKDTSKLKEIQKLLATAPNWYETEFIDVDVKTFMDKCKKKFDNSYEEYMDDIKAFICQIYIEVSRNLWDNVELFTDSCSNAVKDKNQEKIKKIIADTVKEQVKEFEIPKEMDKFEALTQLLDREDDKEQRSDREDDIEQRSNGSDYEDIMFGGKTMRSDKEDREDDIEEEDRENEEEDREDDDNEEEEDREDEEGDHDDDKESDDEDGDESDDSVIEVDITPSKSKKEKYENDEEENREDDDEEEDNDDELFGKSEDEQSETEDSILEEQNLNSETSSFNNDKKSFNMDKSKVMNIMEEAEKKLQDDPDLTDENIENFLKFKKFLEMTKKVKVENFEEVLQKALETPKETPKNTSEETPKETPKKQAPIPKPPRTRRKSAPKPAIVEPSFEEIVEEESLGLFDAPLKAPDPPQRRGKKK